MGVHAEKLCPFHAYGPIAQGCALSRAGNNSDVVGHDCHETARFYASARKVIENARHTGTCHNSTATGVNQL